MKNKILIICTIMFLSLTAFSQTKRQDIVDDAHTWFEAGNGEALGANNVPVSTGWYSIHNLKVLGEYPNRSAFKIVISKAGKVIATTRCETGRYINQDGGYAESFMATGDCWKKDTSTKETGNFDVDVFTINGDTDEEKLVRKYKIEVKIVNQVEVGQGKGIAPPKYYINRHNETAASWIFLRPREYYAYDRWQSGSEMLGANHVEFYFNLSPSEMGKMIPHGYMRCSVNGKRLSMPGPEGFADQALSSTIRKYSAIYQDRIAPQYKSGREYRDEIRFSQVRLLAPLTWGEKRNRWEQRLALDDYPGNWECSLMNNGVAWRTWRFSVANGKPAIHPEQKGNINLGYHSFLVDMEIPAGGTDLDERLGGASTSLFYGQPWTSAEGKATAAKIPKKGNAFPVASNSPTAVKQ